MPRFLLHGLGQRRGAQIGAEGGDCIGPCLGNLAQQFLQPSRFDQREIVVDTDFEVAFSNHLDSKGAVVVDDALLHIGRVGRHEAEPLNSAQGHQLVERQHRRGGANAGALGDALAQAAISIKAEPARGRAAPADRIDLRIGQQFRGGEDLAVVELAERLGRQRDLSHGEA